MRDILDEQIAYYRARAAEYDASLGRSEAAGQAAGPLGALVFAEAARRLRGLGEFEEALELACGTGEWTRVLLSMARRVSVVDAAPEMLEQAQRKLGEAPVRYRQADLFEWEPGAAYDLVFFANWLSHVPPEALELFLSRVQRAVKVGGRLAVVDQFAPGADDQNVAQGTHHARRPLRDGQTFTIVKVFYPLEALERQLGRLGFEAQAERLDERFFLLTGQRTR